MSFEIDRVINESVIDWTRNSLDPLIFDKIDDKYVMKDRIKNFIYTTVDRINRDIIKVNDYFIKGSILSFQWLDNTDIDLLLEIDDVDDDSWRKIQDEIDSTFATDVPGTEHPLQIYALGGKYDMDNADGVYRLDSGWVKGPYNFKVNIAEYMPKFGKVVASIDTKTGRLKRNLIDYEIMKKLPESEVEGLEAEIGRKIDQIDDSVDELVNSYKHIRDMRHHVFERKMTPEEIVKYGSKNSLPDNVVYKMLERYYYIKFLSELKYLVKDDESIDSDEKVEQIKDVVDEYM